MRQFAKDLGVTHATINLWEHDIEVSLDTLRSWWCDERDWVRNMAVAVMAARFPGLIRANGGNPRGD